ncbi:MAG: SIMPL domain-containing protein [Gammaproteobacteria bacterium]|nr:SIMPL domain-containing protein [Gammaproteobacteria bacterium]
MKKAKMLLLLFLLNYVPLSAVADDTLTYDRISLDVTASEEIDNDTLTAILYFQRQGRNSADVADKVNQMITWGVERARQEQNVKVKTLDYQTQPLYQNGKLSGIWQVRQSFRLESKDVTRLSTLLEELQEKLAIQHIGYQLSADKRRQAEDTLTKTVIARFKQKARLVAQQFNANDFRIVSLNISSSGFRGRPMPMMRAMGGMLESDIASAPVLEAGEQTVQVGINGVIELMRE